MGKYIELSKAIIEKVGGKENIASLTHCVTRLRFQLKDKSLADMDALKNMDGVVTALVSSGQFQVVIGNHVPEVFAQVCAEAGIAAGSSQDEPKKTVSQAVLDFISGVFGPILAVLCASGMIQGFLSLALFLGLVSETSGLYQIIYAIGQSLFYFFPVLLGYSCFAKLGGSAYLGALVGAAMIYPSIQGVDLDIMGMIINNSYTSTVLPIIFTSFLGVFLEKRLNKIVPTVIKNFVVPALVLLISVPAGFIAIGSFANVLSDMMANGIMAAFSASPVLAGALLGGLWQVLVIFGIHQGLIGVAIAGMASAGMTPIFALVTGTTFAQTGIVAGIWARTKDSKLKSVALPAWISGIFGVTEPAIYGVTLPRMKFFVLSCLIAALGGAAMGYFGVVNYIMGGLGIFSLPSMFGQSLHDGLVASAVSIVCTAAGFAAAFMTFKDEKVKAEPAEKKADKKSFDLASPLAGTVMPLGEVSDAVFSCGALGNGCAILPEAGVVVAPASGKVTTLFPTLHAVGIECEDGAEVLVHVGINTVELNGKHFKPFVSQGDLVKKGQKLLEFDMEAISKAGYSLETPVIVTNTASFKDVLPTLNKKVARLDSLMAVLA